MSKRQRPWRLRSRNHRSRSCCLLQLLLLQLLLQLLLTGAPTPQIETPADIDAGAEGPTAAVEVEAMPSPAASFGWQHAPTAAGRQVLEEYSKTTPTRPAAFCSCCANGSHADMPRSTLAKYKGWSNRTPGKTNQRQRNRTHSEAHSKAQSDSVADLARDRQPSNSEPQPPHLPTVASSRHRRPAEDLVERRERLHP